MRSIEKLLGEVLAAKTPNARAAAMHVVADEARLFAERVRVARGRRSR